MATDSIFTITRVDDGKDYYTIHDECCVTGIEKKTGYIPRVGDKIQREFHRGILRRIYVNGEVEYALPLSACEQQADARDKAEEEKKLRDFEKAKPHRDKEYSQLPECFQKRLDRFRINNPRFRVEYESYEMFCCKEAVKIAKKLKTFDAVEKFQKLKWEEQIKLVPAISKEHSGNTFGMAVYLAYWYLKNPESVYQIHGSLSVLVGSEEYGDTARAAGKGK